MNRLFWLHPRANICLSLYSVTVHTMYPGHLCAGFNEVAPKTGTSMQHGLATIYVCTESDKC